MPGILYHPNINIQHDWLINRGVKIQQMVSNFTRLYTNF